MKQSHRWKKKGRTSLRSDQRGRIVAFVENGKRVSVRRLSFFAAVRHDYRRIRHWWHAQCVSRIIFCGARVRQAGKRVVTWVLFAQRKIMIGARIVYTRYMRNNTQQRDSAVDAQEVLVPDLPSEAVASHRIIAPNLVNGHHVFYVRIWRGFVFLLRNMAWSLFDVAVIVALCLIVGFFYIYITVPDVSVMRNPSAIAETTVIYDKTGTVVLYEIHGEENRRHVAHDDIADTMRAATIAAEDDAFYTHIGIDPFAIARAIKENLLRDALAQGGSTITQQLARNVFFSREKTLSRKLREAVMAIKIEHHYTKDEILDAYLNVVPYGSNAYGVESASRTYFNKSAKDLTLDEAAFLAAIPKATTTFSPYGTHTNRLVARQKMILERMRELSLAPDDAIDAALTVDTLARVQPFRQSIVAPHFVFYVIEELERLYGRTFVERGGLRVITTLDLGLQSDAEKIVRDGAQRAYALGGSNAALVAIDPKTGGVITMVGSKDYYNVTEDGQVNVTMRLRQPGSAMKPIVYAAAFSKGYQPETMLFDVRTDFGPDGSGGSYMPQNYDGRFRGLTTLRQALAQSLNIPAVKVLYLTGIDAAIDFAEKMGITSLTDRHRYGLALVLGGAEVRPLELTSAYGIFAHDGVRIAPHGIALIKDRDGNVLYDAATVYKPERVMDAEVARKINSILSDNGARTPVFGRNSPLVVSGHLVAAKTGTTQNFRDAWTVGYTPSLAVGVWVGNNDGHPMRVGAASAMVAAPLWHVFMEKALTIYGSDEVFPAYTPVTCDVPMVCGKYSGTIIREERVVGSHAKGHDRVVSERRVFRDILFYIDKEHPLTPRTTRNVDPMAQRWDAALFRTTAQTPSKQ